MSRRIPAPVPSLVAALSWGGMFPIAAAALPRVDPFNLTAIRYGLASILFVLVLAISEGRRAVGFDGRLLRVFVLGSLGFAGFNLLTYVGLEHTAPQNAALIVALMPLVTLLVRWLLDGIRPSTVQLVGVAAALVGVALVISHGHLANLLDGLQIGELFVLGGVIGWIFYTRGAATFPGWSALRYTAMTAVAGTVTILAATAVADMAGWQTLPSGADVWAEAPAIVYVVVFGALIAVLAWNLGVQRLGVANAALFMNLVPITTFTIEIARGYRPVAGEIIGAVVTVTALVGVNLAGRPGRAAAPAPAPARARRRLSRA